MCRGASKFAATSLALLLLGLIACDKPDPLLEELRTLQNRSVPPGAMAVEKTNLVRNDQTASATWEFETDWDWEKYSTWLNENVPNGYKRITAEKTSLQFRRSLPGDVYAIGIESRMSDRLRIRIQFSASPD
jgi:hypothetical protein